MRIVLAVSATVLSLAAQSDLRSLLESGHYRRAKSIAEQRLKSNNSDSEAHYTVSLAYYRSGDLERALPPPKKRFPSIPKTPSITATWRKSSDRRRKRLPSSANSGSPSDAVPNSKPPSPSTHVIIRRTLVLMLYLLKAPGLFGGDKTRARAMPDADFQIRPIERLPGQSRLTREENPKANIARPLPQCCRCQSKKLRSPDNIPGHAAY